MEFTEKKPRHTYFDNDFKKSTLSNFLRYKVIAMTKHFFLKSQTEKLLPTFNTSMKNWPERDLPSEAL